MKNPFESTNWWPIVKTTMPKYLLNFFSIISNKFVTKMVISDFFRIAHLIQPNFLASKTGS